MSDVIISIPGATDVVTETGAASSVIVSFPASNNVVTTVIDRGILYGIQGAQGPQGATGATGPQGPKGETGAGVATGGTAGQVLQKSSSVDYETQWHTLVKSDVGLGNVDNTSDADKPISTAVQTALNAKAPSSGINATAISDGSVDNTEFGYLNGVTSAIQTQLNAKANSATTITINGVAYDLSANRSWSVGDVMTSGSYANPSWITSLAWSKISGTPTTLSGYGITDAVPSSRTLTINGVAYDLSANRSWTISEADTLATVTARGASTTLGITVGGLISNGSVTASGAIARGVYVNNTLVASANNDVLVGLDINPTFTVGSFTGTTVWALRTSWSINITSVGGFYGGLIINSSRITNPVQNSAITIHSPSSGVANYLYEGSRPALPTTKAITHYVGTDNHIYWDTTNAPYKFLISGTQYVQFFNSTGNVVIQNGGTFTDAGYRLDVVGADARFNGVRAGLGAGSVATNTVFGNGALNSNSSGTELVAIGRNALSANTTGIRNVAIGDTSLFTNQTGGLNVAVGMSALRLNVSGFNNVGIGMTALFNNLASSNVGVGFEAGYTNTNGTGLTAIGYQTLKASTGNNNTAIGYQAGLNIALATNNTLVGVQAGSLITTGSGNTIVGQGANTANNNDSGATAVGINTVSHANSVVLGRGAATNAANQFAVGSSTYNAGSVATEINTSTKVWNVIINGVAQKILLA